MSRAIDLQGNGARTPVTVSPKLGELALPAAYQAFTPLSLAVEASVLPLDIL